MKVSFNVNRLIEMWQPELLRKPKHLAWLQTVLKPVTTLWNAVLEYRNAKLYEATITGETNRLEKALQDKYENPGIYFTQPTDYLDTAWIFLKIEPKFQEYDFLKSEEHEPPVYDFLKSEYDPDFDFVVRVPNSLSIYVNEIKAFLKKYILAGKRYKIELY